MEKILEWIDRNPIIKWLLIGGGLLLIALAFYQGREINIGWFKIGNNPTTTTPSPPTPTPTPTETLTGNWSGTDGFMYKITQQNNSIMIQKIDPLFGEITATGKGEIKDGKVLINYETISQSGGPTNLTIEYGRLRSDETPPTVLIRQY